jgi:hypothetical protein
MKLGRLRCDEATMRTGALAELARHGITGEAAVRLADKVADWCWGKRFSGVGA